MQVEGSIAPRPTKFVYNPAMTPRRVLWIVGLIALATGIAYVWRCGIIYYDDSSSYLVPATNMLHGHGFTDAQGTPEVLRTPGYPLFIDLFLWIPHGIGVLIVAGTR